MENSMEVLQEIKIQLPYDSATLLLGMYPQKWKQGMDQSSALPCLLQHIVNQEMEKCPSMGE